MLQQPATHSSLMHTAPPVLPTNVRRAKAMELAKQGSLQTYWYQRATFLPPPTTKALALQECTHMLWALVKHTACSTSFALHVNSLSQAASRWCGVIHKEVALHSWPQKLRRNTRPMHKLLAQLVGLPLLNSTSSAVFLLLPIHLASCSWLLQVFVPHIPLLICHN